jgi:hypothetical protein
MKKIITLFTLLSLLISFNAISQLTTSLEEYYKFDESSGHAINSVNASVNPSNSESVTYSSTGKINTAFSFNGTSNRVSFNDNANWTISTAGNLSISMWIYFTADLTGTYATLWGHQNGPMYYLTKMSSGNYQICWWAGNAESKTGTLAFSLNTWYHLVFVKSGTAITFYRNGSIAGTATASDNNMDPVAVYIGGDTYTPPQAFKGTIDEVGIWKRVLSFSEVTQLYNSGNGLPYSSFGGTIAVTGVTVAPTSATVSVGGTTQLTATITPSNSTNQAVTWSTSNSSVATVNTSGLVTGVAAGTATITVTTSDGGKTATSTITVTSSPIAVTGVAVAPTSASIIAGNTTQLTATVSPSNATNKTVTWSTNNASAATVNSSGLVTGVAAGTATITVTTQDGNKTATCTITVTASTGGDNLGNHTATQSIKLNGFWLGNDGGNEGIRIDNNGNIGIGTSTPTQPLTVRGKILATEVEVVSSISADYVFEPDYLLMPLTELEKYLKQNKHLPDFPSAADFTKQGQNLGKTDDLLLRKIEELTLYIIKQQKEIEHLKSCMRSMKDREK